jgi:polygalacturonase
LKYKNFYKKSINLIYMKKRRYLILVIFFSFFLFTFNGYIEAQAFNKIISSLKWANTVGAKTMPTGTKIYKVNDYGGNNDGKTVNTGAIQKAIDVCSANGGGIVVFEAGSYITGSIFVKKNVHLKIDKEVTIVGSQDIADYPEIDTRVAGIEMKWPAALINILNEDNVAISGDGTVFANGHPFWEKYWAMRKEYDAKGLRWIVDYDCKRPRAFLVSGSSNITLKGFTVRQAGFWTVQLLYSKYVTVNGLTIQNNIDGKGPSTDGVDIDSSSFVLIENCDIDCNDDNFCLKAGRDADGIRINRPTEYIVIRNCISRKGSGLITCGSETAGSIRNVLAYNLKAKGTSNGFNFKSAITRGGTVENIYIHDIELDSVNTALLVTMNWNPSYSYSKLPPEYHYDSIPPHWKTMLQQVSPKDGTPTFRNIYIANVKGTARNLAISATGMKESPAEGFNLYNIEVSSGSAGKICFAKNWKCQHVIITAKDSSQVDIQECSDVKL